MKGTVSGENNPFYGKRHTTKTIAKLRAEGAKAQKLKKEHKSLRAYWTDKYGAEEANRLIDARRKKLSVSMSGSGNPMFGKPSPQGSGNGWSGWYKGFFFRSLLELSYMVKEIEGKGLRWRSAEAKDMRIEYLDWEGQSRNYFADFFVEDHILVECKPFKLHNTPSVQLKQKAAIEFCNDRGHDYLLTDCELLTDEQVVLLYECGDLVFTHRYERKFKERTNHEKYT